MKVLESEEAEAKKKKKKGMEIERDMGGLVRVSVAVSLQVSYF